jgi:hypothetical protein
LFLEEHHPVLILFIPSLHFPSLPGLAAYCRGKVSSCGLQTVRLCI